MFDHNNNRCLKRNMKKYFVTFFSSMNKNYENCKKKKLKPFIIIKILYLN